MRKVISFTRPRPLFTFTVQMFPGSWFLAPDPRSWCVQFPWICLPFSGYVPRSWLWLRLRLRSYVLVCSWSWSPGSGYVTYVHRYILLPCLWCWCGPRSGYVHGLLVTVTFLHPCIVLYVHTVAHTFYITYIHATLLYILNTIGIR